MKVKLLKKIRSHGRSRITIISVTTTNGITTGMKVGYDSPEYSGLFEMGDTESVVKEKACRIYLQNNMQSIRERFLKRRSIPKRH